MELTQANSEKIVLSQKEVSPEEWDNIIRPKVGLFDLQLKEVWHYRDLLWLFVKRDFVAAFKQTILGPLWHVIQPVFTTLMFLLVFSKIANIKTDDIPSPLFYMASISLWNYFSSCLLNTSNTFVGNAGIFGKVYFPRLIIPLSVVVSNIFKFAIQFALVILMLIWYHFFNGYSVSITSYTLLLPILVAIMAGIGLGLGIIVSSLTTKYRDFVVLIGFAVQLGIYATPIAYPVSFLKEKSYAWLININPLTSVVEAFRYALFQKGTFDLSGLIYSFTFMVVLLVLGAIIFNRVEKTFMDTV